MAVLIDVPVRVPYPTPRELRYGLFTVANGPLELPAHGGDAGVQWLASTCGEALGYEVQCLDSLLDKGPFADPLELAVATPFAVTTGFTCASVGLSVAEREAMVLQRLQALEQGAVEHIFSEGLFGQSPSLANNDPAATVLTASGGIIHAFSRLEEAFYDTYGYPGTIHLPHSASAFAEAARVMSMRDGIWTTAAGSQVSIGNYSGVSPVGAAPAANTAWVYITAPVTIWRESDVFTAPVEAALDRTTNQVTIFAEREYALGYDPCPVYATLTTLEEGQ